MERYQLVKEDAYGMTFYSMNELEINNSISTKKIPSELTNGI